MKGQILWCRDSGGGNKEKKGGSRDERATSSNLNVHVIQHLTC